MNDISRICLWSSPRNISTALMYSFAQRADTVVYDEPFYGFYLKHSEASTYHPGALETMKSMECDGENVTEMLLGPHPKPVAFFKSMSHHLLHLDRGFLARLQNVILTRDPSDMITSFAKVIPHPVMRDLGYAEQVEMLQYLQSNRLAVHVLDARQVLENPRETLSALCDRVGIPFDDRMLSWKPGPRPEDGPWARYWYAGVHASAGFKPYAQKAERVPRHLYPLLEEAMGLHETLLKASVQ